MALIASRLIGTLNATRERDNHPVTINVYREQIAQRFTEGTSAIAEGRRMFKLDGTTLRVDGSDMRFLTDGRDRYLTSEPVV